ncbi:transglycosylase family protein [Conexibacter sp. CPCC 206217]|uniref:transglycosylase family protein n=1 Tax=Conexibacter sp. CPCC 206217 TaxID=3064574 RepID=UPI002725C307|nr:transglycosylase family protein [Conexibacter sp. CPCC 206217]MDO8214040.1 transglycosylase family protein [Conexibacter sp. CPCC 206217]
MPANCPDVDADDLVQPERWERSRERSHVRRLVALRRRRRRRGSRSVALVMAAALTLGVGGAFAASGDDDGSGGGSLKRGSSGPAVVQLQQKLGIGADGAFGPQTEKAVRAYQRRKGLEVDGVVGPQTAGALGISLATARAQSVGRGGSAGSSVQLPPILDSIAECESGGDPRAISSDGTYRGKYQFDRSTWAAYGSAGDPARASEAEQDRRALKLYNARGTSPWPNCA